VKPDARAAKVHAALARLQLPLEYRITRTAPLEPLLTCLNVVHASAAQLDSLTTLEVQFDVPQLMPKLCQVTGDPRSCLYAVAPKPTVRRLSCACAM
jgi:hypothetical protein